MKSSIVTVATASASFVLRVVVVVLVVLVRVLFVVVVVIDVFVILVVLVVVVVIVVSATAVLFVVGVFILVVVSKVFSSIDFIDVVFAHHRDVLPFRRLLVASSRPFASAVLFVGIFVVLHLLFFLLLPPARGSFRRQSLLHLLLLLLLLRLIFFHQSARRRRKRKTATTLTFRQRFKALLSRKSRRQQSRLFALFRRLRSLLIVALCFPLERATVAFFLLFCFFDLLFSSLSYLLF